jgi:dihydroorotase
MDLLVKNGRLSIRRENRQVTNVVIREGVIRAVGDTTMPDLPVFDATGSDRRSGFSTFMCTCASPVPKRRRPSAAAAVRLCRRLYAVAAMPNTKPPNDNPSITHFIVSEARRSSPARVFPIGAITKEQKGETLAEIGEMLEAGAVGISDDGKPVMNAHCFGARSNMRRCSISRSFSIAKT